MSVDSYVREKQEINFFIGGSIIMDYGFTYFFVQKTLIDGLEPCGFFVNYLYNLILTAPIHCKIIWWASDVIQNFSKSVLMEL